jgi:hypothetical protein
MQFRQSFIVHYRRSLRDPTLNVSGVMPNVIVVVANNKGVMPNVKGVVADGFLSSMTLLPKS